MAQDKKSKSFSVLTVLYKIGVFVCSAVNAVANIAEYFG